MNGRIRNLVMEKGFGFIATRDNTEYFFHRSGFLGHWEDLVSDYKSLGKNSIDVTFDVEESQKGPRATNVKRVDWPNAAA